MRENRYRKENKILTVDLDKKFVKNFNLTQTKEKKSNPHQIVK